ncbi:MAG: hypothetical protein AAF152_15940 [Cyanobacteria bacterium P01_A01_bin.114]
MTSSLNHIQIETLSFYRRANCGAGGAGDAGGGQSLGLEEVKNNVLTESSGLS